MKTITNFLILVLGLTLITGCMPSSFSKWKQNAPTTKKPTSVFQDSSGNPIPSDGLSFPTYLDYHRSPLANPQVVSTAATSNTVFTPALDGDLLSGYPFNSKGQALAPSFSLESLPVPYNCGGTLLSNPGTVSNLTINAASGVVTLAPAVLTTLVSSPIDYCVKLTYKTPTSVKPGYTYAYLYGVLSIRPQTPLTAFSFKQSEHLILELTSYVDLNQFTKNNSITATSGAVATVEYFNKTARQLYVTATTTTASLAFKPGDSIRVGSGGIGAPYYDARIGTVTNLHSPASSMLIPNLITYPISAVLNNGITFSGVTPNPPFVSFDTTTGTYTVISSAQSAGSVQFTVQNGLSGSVLVPFDYQIIKGYYPPIRSGELRFPHSATITLDIGTVSGNFSDFAVSAVATSNGGATGTILNTTTNTLTGAKTISLSVTATGTEGFVDGNNVTVGSSKAKITKVTNVFVVGSTNNILTHNGEAFAPFWSNGDQVGNGIEYDMTLNSGDDSFIETATSTGVISGFSPSVQRISYNVRAFNGHGEVAKPLYIAFELKGSSTLTIAYVQKKVASCNSRIKLLLDSPQAGYTFVKGKLIWANNAKESSSATITYVDPANKFLIADIQQGYFLANQFIDSNTATYTVNRATISKVVNIFEKDVPLCANQVVPVLNPTGAAVSYELTPDLPSQALGLSFDTTTGFLTGTPTTEILEQDHVVKASGAIGQAEIGFSFQIATTPRALSYSRQVVMEVNRGDEFYPGSSISSPKTDTSGETKASGVVRHKINTANSTSILIVDVTNGTFDQYASVDKYSTYKDPRAEILSVTNSTFSITYGGGLSASDVGKYVYNLSTSKQAVITAIDTAANYIALRLVKGSFVTGDTFCVSTNSALTACPSVPYTIASLDAPSLRLALGTAVAYSPGETIYSSPGGVVYNSLMVTGTTTAGTAIDVLTQSYENKVAVNNSIYHAYTQVPAPSTISSVTYNHTLYMYQDEEVNIYPDLMEGSDIVYSQTGSLPPGLSFNSETGIISGKILNSTTSTSTPVTITAYNFMGSTSHTFNIKAFRHFEIKTKMQDAPGMLTHREGPANKVAPCRITWEQAQLGTAYDKSILCYVEAGELDLYKEGVAFSAFAGKNMCEKFVYAPYYMWSFPVGETDYFYSYKYNCACTNDNTQGAIRGCDTANNGKQLGGGPANFDMRNGIAFYNQSGAYISKENSLSLCAYNYTLSDGKDKKCDEGRVNVVSRTFIDDPTDAGYCTVKPDAASCATRLACEDATVDCDGAPGTATGTTGKWMPNCVEDTDLAVTDLKEQCDGKAYECVEGGAKDEFTVDAFTSGKRSQIVAAVNGYSNNFVVKSPLSLSQYTNLRVANYTNRNSCAYTGVNDYHYYTTNWSAYAAVTAANVDPHGQTNPFYTFSCLDAAGDAKAVIRILVRDWNRGFDVDKEIDRIIPGGNLMDVQTNDPVMGGNYNDYSDWDDRYEIGRRDLPGAASLNSCDIGTPVTVTPYPFPREYL